MSQQQLLGGMGNCESIDEDKMHVPRQGPVNEIVVTNSAWARKYLGLYDYETQDINTRKMKVEGNCVIMKEHERLIKIDEKLDRRGITEHLKNSLFKLERLDNFYHLHPIVYEEHGDLIQKPLWMVVRTLPNKHYSIKERDIIKLGKQKIKVREVVPGDLAVSAVVPQEDIRLSKAVYDDLHFKEKPKMPKDENVKSAVLNLEAQDKKLCLEEKEKGSPLKQLLPESTQTIQVEEATQGESEHTCRICLQEGMVSNPLITPCKCIGSVRYIHLMCLKQWLSKQIKAVVNDFSVTINWKPLICEMCKSHYKYRIYLDNKKFYTVDIPKPEKPYIVLEIMRKKNKEEGKIFKFITFKVKDRISIGRRKDVDVRISEDISVSRVHATLSYKNQTSEFILEDNRSKFGTLVMAKNGLLLRPHHAGLSVQIGAEVYAFEALRQQSESRNPNYELGEIYLPEDLSEESDEEEEGSEEEDEVNELPMEDDNRSPTMSRSSPLRRSLSQPHSSSSIM